MTDQTETPDPLQGEGTGEGVDMATGEPNTFEPEEDPEAAPIATDEPTD